LAHGYTFCRRSISSGYVYFQPLTY
jgi:hypothetical protein